MNYTISNSQTQKLVDVESCTICSETVNPNLDDGNERFTRDLAQHV